MYVIKKNHRRRTLTRANTLMLIYEHMILLQHYKRPTNDEQIRSYNNIILIGQKAIKWF